MTSTNFLFLLNTFMILSEFDSPCQAKAFFSSEKQIATFILRNDQFCKPYRIQVGFLHCSGRQGVQATYSWHISGKHNLSCSHMTAMPRTATR